MHHACAKCGCTVFTLESPRSQVGGYAINTGIKLATCMECGSQERPKEVDDMIQKKEQEALTYAHLKREREEQKRYACQPYQQLLTEWLKRFNTLTGEQNYESESDRHHRREGERQRAEDWRDYQLGRY